MRRAGRDRSSSGCRLAPAPAAHPEPHRAPFGQPGSWDSLCFPSFSRCIPLDVPGVAVRRDRDTSRGSPVPSSGDINCSLPVPEGIMAMDTGDIPWKQHRELCPLHLSIQEGLLCPQGEFWS